MAVNLANILVEKYQAYVKDAIENAEYKLMSKITVSEMDGEVTYVDREGLSEAPISQDTSALDQYPLTSAGGFADFAAFQASLTPNMGRTRIRTEVRPKTAFWGNTYENEDEFESNLDKGKIVPQGMKVMENQIDKYIIASLDGSMTRLDPTTGNPTATAFLAGQDTPIDLTATGVLDYDAVQAEVSKFDQVGYTGQICCILTPKNRDILMQDDRFADNDYAKFVDYGRLDKHTLTDTERVTFIVLPSSDYTMPRADLTQGAKLADTKILFWAPEAVEGGYFGTHIAEAAKSIDHRARWKVYMERSFGSCRADDAGVSRITVTHV